MEPVTKYFALFMSLIYVAFGAIIAWGSSSVFNKVPTKYSLPMGIILIAYGLFRGYRVYQKHFTN